MVFENGELNIVKDYIQKPRNGFLLGKFLPVTEGHRYLCDFAQNYCENLTILVCSMPDEPIPGVLRYNWMKELFPRCNVVWCDEVLPQEPKDENDTEFWKIWVDTIYNYGIWNEEVPDVIFASENYGIRLAKELNCSFVPCDMKRLSQKCSGTAIRANPKLNWNYIPDVVKPYFVKRITLAGPENSGKSTLAAQLADHYKTILVPEYGRTYTEVFGSEVGSGDIQKIVQGHLASVAAAKKLSNYILIEDTDPVMSGVWSEILTGQKDEYFNQFKDYPDLYILCDNRDVPWQDDGTRYFSKDEDRRKFFDLCKKELDKRKVSYIIVSGNVEERKKESIKVIDKL